MHAGARTHAIHARPTPLSIPPALHPPAWLGRQIIKLYKCGPRTDVSVDSASTMALTPHPTTTAITTIGIECLVYGCHHAAAVAAARSFSRWRLSTTRARMLGVGGTG